MNAVDELLAELDMCALADAVGVLRAGPVEPPALERGRAIRRARARRVSREYRGRCGRTFDDLVKGAGDE